MTESETAALRHAVARGVRAMPPAIRSRNSRPLLAIGFVTSDDLNNMGAFLLYDDDPVAQDRELKYLPGEWSASVGEMFNDADGELQRLAAAGVDRTIIADAMFEAAGTDELVDDLRAEFGEGLFITFQGLDSVGLLERLGAAFARRVNSPEVIKEMEALGLL